MMHLFHHGSFWLLKVFAALGTCAASLNTQTGNGYVRVLGFRCVVSFLFFFPAGSTASFEGACKVQHLTPPRRPVLETKVVLLVLSMEHQQAVF